MSIKYTKNYTLYEIINRIANTNKTPLITLAIIQNVENYLKETYKDFNGFNMENYNTIYNYLTDREFIGDYEYRILKTSDYISDKLELKEKKGEEL